MVACLTITLFRAHQTIHVVPCSGGWSGIKSCYCKTPPTKQTSNSSATCHVTIYSSLARPRPFPPKTRYWGAVLTRIESLHSWWTMSLPLPAIPPRSAAILASPTTYAHLPSRTANNMSTIRHCQHSIVLSLLRLTDNHHL